MQKRLYLKLWKIICAFIFLCGWTDIYARTAYSALEKRQDLHIFSEYVDFLSKTKNPYKKFSKLTIGDKEWQAVSRKHHNTISNVYYSKYGYIVIDNYKYNFKVHVTPSVIDNSIIWKCGFVDDKIFSDPICTYWEKEMVIMR